MSKQSQTAAALLLENIHEQAETTLREYGLQIQRLKKTPESKELIARLKNINVLCIRSRTSINKEILFNSQLDCIGAFCIGVNQIDLDAACRQGVPVFNAPYGNTRSVAEMVIGLIIGLSRSLFDHSRNMHQGKWKKFTEGCFELRGKTLGIVGYGHIGSQVSVLAEALGMRVLYYDIISKLPIGNARPAFRLKELLEGSDFVTIHVPETPLTKKLIGKKEIAMMKKQSFLINTSRGSVLDISAVESALSAKHLAGIALDVFMGEPQTSEDRFSFSLQNKENVVLTPHVGGSTQEAQISIASEVSKSLKDFLFQGTTYNAVNFPSLLAPPVPEKVTRITNIHKNQPGVLSRINKMISESNINIKNQYLATDESIGYLIMDLETKDVQSICRNMSSLDTSIKTRLIFPQGKS